MPLTLAAQDKVLEILDEWTHDVRKLAEQVTGWAYQEPGWTVEEADTDKFEDYLGTYAVPVVTIDTPRGRLILEPIARNYPGKGIVEFYAWPTLFRVRLLLDEEAAWRVRVDSGFLLHQEWNRENFITLANDLLGAS